MRHMLDEAGLAASGGTFEQDRQPRLVGGREDFHFVANRQIVGRRRWIEMTDFRAFMRALHPRIKFLQFNRHRSPVLGVLADSRRAIALYSRRGTLWYQRHARLRVLDA